MKLLVFCIALPCFASDVDPKKIKIPPPPRSRKRFIPSNIATREKLAYIRAMLNAELGKKKE